MTSTIPVARASLVQAVLSQRCPGLSIPGSFGRTTHSASVLPLFILLPLMTDKNWTWKGRMRESLIKGQLFHFKGDKFQATFAPGDFQLESIFHRIQGQLAISVGHCHLGKHMKPKMAVLEMRHSRVSQIVKAGGILPTQKKNFHEFPSHSGNLGYAWCFLGSRQKWNAPMSLARSGSPERVRRTDDDMTGIWLDRNHHIRHTSTDTSKSIKIPHHTVIIQSSYSHTTLKTAARWHSRQLLPKKPSSVRQHHAFQGTMRRRWWEERPRPLQGTRCQPVSAVTSNEIHQPVTQPHLQSNKHGYKIRILSGSNAGGRSGNWWNPLYQWKYSYQYVLWQFWGSSAIHHTPYPYFRRRMGCSPSRWTWWLSPAAWKSITAVSRAWCSRLFCCQAYMCTVFICVTLV